MSPKNRSSRGRKATPDRRPAPRRTRAGGDGSGRAQPEGYRPGPRPQALSELGGDQVEGRRAVLELLSVGRRTVRRIMLAEDQDPSPQLDRIEELAARLRETGAPRLAAAGAGAKARARPRAGGPDPDPRR